MKRLTAVLLCLCLLAGCKSSPVETPAPTSDGRELTAEEIGQVNEAYAACEQKGDLIYASTAVNGFFLSHYSDPRELDFSEFLSYYPDAGNLDEGPEEFAALSALPGFPWKAADFEKETLSATDLPVPTHRIPRSAVDETLKRYAGITTADLTNTEGTLYLPEYNAYYTFTSDFGPGVFDCAGGEVWEDRALLWTQTRDDGVREELTLKKEGESWYIQSFLRAAEEGESSLDARLMTLTAEEIGEVSWSGFQERPDGEKAAALVRTAAQNSDYDWHYGGTLWDLTLTLTDGDSLFITAGEKEDIVCISSDQLGTGYFRAPELYWCLRGQNGSTEKKIDQEGLERYRGAVDAYLAQFEHEDRGEDVTVREELIGFYPIDESEKLNAQVWWVGTATVTDPPEAIYMAMGNGYVDRDLRFWGISDEPRNLLVTIDGKAMAYQSWTWLEAQGLDRFETVEELETALWPISRWEKEVLSDKPGDTRVVYSVTTLEGERLTLLDTDRMTEERDPDGDGETELLAYGSKENKKTVGIYDIIDGTLQYLDVNEALGAEWSDYMGNIGNVEWPYGICFQAGYSDKENQVYRYEPDGTLTYICPLEDALRK